MWLFESLTFSFKKVDTVKRLFSTSWCQAQGEARATAKGGSREGRFGKLCRGLSCARPGFLLLFQAGVCKERTFYKKLLEWENLK